MDIFLLQVLNSLFYASVLFLLAAGLSLIFGVMGIINLAHGMLYAVGAYVTAWAVTALAAQVHPAVLFLLLPLGAVVVAAVGMVIEPVLLRPMYKRPEEYQLLITFGMLLVLEDLIRLIWGGTPLSASPLIDTMGIIRTGSFVYPAYNLLVILIGIAAAIGLWAFVYKTRFGVLLRATSQNRRMASALGLNVGRTYIQAFGIGCFLAGLGGAIVVPSQAAVLGMGVEVLVIAFVVVVIGGLGSLEGALIGALIVSFLRTGVIQFYEEFELAALYLVAAVVLLVRPTGLFGKSQ
jgi:branched-chain amino acid transport system permease protein